MQCNKKKRVVITSAIGGLIIVLLIITYLIYDINKRFPEPSIQTYDFETPAEENGLVITPMEYKVRTYDEYYNVYGEDGVYASAKMYKPERTRIVTFTIQYENKTSDNITYETDSVQMMGEKSGVNNGVLLEGNKKNKSTIAPGEIQQYELSTLILTPSGIQKKWINRLDEETFYLVYNWYPSIKRLEF